MRIVYKTYRTSDRGELATFLVACLELLVLENLMLARHCPGGRVPDPYKSKVKYLQEPPEWRGVEHLDNFAICIARGWGDCDDLVGWRVAFLRQNGEPTAKPRVIWPQGESRFHARIRRANLDEEDPSISLKRMNGGDVVL